MKTVTSKDGATIAFEKTGQGPAVIMVVGAFNDRTTAVPLSQLLEQDFTLFNYDRRGRGDSGDTPPYAVEREIEDLDALIEEAGGSAFVFGYSSGAVLALRAAEPATHETRHGAHTGSGTAGRSPVPLAEGSSARKVTRASRREGIQKKYAVGNERVQGEVAIVKPRCPPGTWGPCPSRSAGEQRPCPARMSRTSQGI